MENNKEQAGTFYDNFINSIFPCEAVPQDFVEIFYNFSLHTYQFVTFKQLIEIHREMGRVYEV